MPESTASRRHAIEPFGPATYGESFADVYDEWYPDVSDADATVGFIDRFGPSQHILELGTGTGRLARALSGAGHRVIGLDASTAMLDRFDAPAANAVGGDMSVLPFAPASFDCVLIATNTLFNLAEASLQARCFADAAAVLRPGGRLVIEADVPAASDPAIDRLVSTRSIDPNRVVLTATIRDDERQTITGQHIDISEDGIRLRPWRIRFIGPDELDQLATSAGLQLAERHTGWDGTHYTTDSHHHVTVYTA